VLEGPANFRDLGGYAAAGGLVVRTGRLFRSDSLASVSDSDVRYIVETLALRSAVDLRAGHEVDDHPHRPLVDAGVAVHHRPIVDETRRRPDDAPVVERGLDEIYALMLDRFGDRFAAVVELVADSDGHPVVFFCAGGKDRTGLVAALVLGALGVDDESIAADYALTAGNLPVLLARNRARADARGIDPEVAHHELLVAEEATMLAVLERLRADHGSVEDYLEGHGLAPEALAALRAGLLA
jgi:protein-tyrosine phosphatase